MVPSPVSIESYAESERFRLFILPGSLTTRLPCSAREGRVCSWNVGAQRFKGYTTEEIIGQHFYATGREDFPSHRRRREVWSSGALRASDTAGDISFLTG